MEENTQITQDKFPMIGKITQRNDNSLSCERTLSLESDCYLDHHRFNNTPFLPGVIGLELFAELGRILFPNKTIQRFEDIHFLSGIRLKKDNPITIYTNIIANDNIADVVITSISKGSSENKSNSKVHFTAKMVFGSRVRERQKIPVLKKLPMLTGEFIYQILPHGSSFQILAELNSIENEMIAVGSFRKRQLFGWKVKELLTEPFILEAGFQAIGLMDFIINGRAGLPSKIKQITYFETDDKPYFIVGRENSEKSGFYDFRILSRKGNVHAKVNDFQMVEINLGDTSSILDKLRSHRIRQMLSIPKKAWLEVIDKQLFLDKLSREPDFVTTFLRKDEIDELEELNEKDKQLLELFALKRSLRVVLRSRKMFNFKLEKDETGEYCCSHKGKYVYLTLMEESNYLLVLASRKRKDGLDFYEEREEIKGKILAIRNTK
ncbi:MAG: hypothetical protein ACTSQ0_10310 [Candidatus Heimdallarchaeota archaeon]